MQGRIGWCRILRGYVWCGVRMKWLEVKRVKGVKEVKRVKEREGIKSVKGTEGMMGAKGSEGGGLSSKGHVKKVLEHEDQTLMVVASVSVSAISYESAGLVHCCGQSSFFIVLHY